MFACINIRLCAFLRRRSHSLDRQRQECGPQPLASRRAGRMVRLDHVTWLGIFSGTDKTLTNHMRARSYRLCTKKRRRYTTDHFSRFHAAHGVCDGHRHPLFRTDPVPLINHITAARHFTPRHPSAYAYCTRHHASVIARLLQAFLLTSIRTLHCGRLQFSRSRHARTHSRTQLFSHFPVAKEYVPQHQASNQSRFHSST